MKVLTTALVALAIHLILGWMWTVAAGVVGGFWVGRGGWRVGAAGVALSWGLLLAYNLLVAGAATQRMATTLGGILGNLPGFAVVLASLLLGGLLGALGGFVGTQFALLVGRRRTSDVAAPESY